MRRRRRKPQLPRHAKRLSLETLESRSLLAVVVDLANLSANEGFVIAGDELQPRAGQAVYGAGDVNGDGFDDVLVGAPGDENSPSGSGAAYLVRGSAGNTADLSLESIEGSNHGWQFSGIEVGGRTGFSVSRAGDMNGDGYEDVVISAPRAGRDPSLGAPFGAGQVYVVFGGFASAPALDALDGANGFAIQGLSLFDRTGFDVSSAGDVNGDGYDDLTVGAPVGGVQFPEQFGPGRSYLVYGKPDGFEPVVNVWELEQSGTGFSTQGVSPGDQFGAAVSDVGDLNGDGFGDFAVSAPGSEGAGEDASDAGEVYVVFGGFTDPPELDALDGGVGFRLTGLEASSQGGFSIAGAGDVNGDGFDDLLIGNPGNSNETSSAGRAFLVFGTDTGFDALVSVADLDGETGFALQGMHAGDMFGSRVAGAGDVNGDGYDDVLIGAPHVDSRQNDATDINVGEAYIFLGRSSDLPTVIDLKTHENDSILRLKGGEENALTGFSVAAAGDINGDGFDDVVIGAPSSVEDPGSAGRAYVVYGRDFTGKEPMQGGPGNDDLTFSTNTTALIGGTGDDTLIWRSNGAVLRGGEGDDTLVIADVGFSDIDGGAGEDTLRWDAEALGFDLSAIPDNRLTGIERIDLSGTGPNHLSIGNAGEVLRISGTSNRLVVLRDIEDTIDRGPGWSEDAPQSIDGRSFRTFVQGAAELLIESVAPLLDLNGLQAVGTGHTVSFVEDAGPVKIAAKELALTSADALVDVEVAITNVRDSADESLTASTVGKGLVANYSPATGTLRITGVGSVDDFAGVLGTLRYHNVSPQPNEENRFVTVRVSDGVTATTATATIQVEAVNDAPTLVAGSKVSLPRINEDATDSQGDTIASLLSRTTVGDLDGNAGQGIAVVLADSQNGTWQYSIADGPWNNLNDASAVAARLLGPTDRVRFQPSADFFGEARLTFRAWDGSHGTSGERANSIPSGGTTAFSLETATAAITVRAVNDAPVIDAAARPTLATIPRDTASPPGDFVGLVIGEETIQDVDGPSSRAIAVVSTDDANGTWQFSANGTSWNDIDTTPLNALLLGPGRRLRFVPDIGFSGTSELTYRAWDESSGVDLARADSTIGGGSTPFSAATGVIRVTVDEADAPPTIGFVPTFIEINDDRPFVLELAGITDGGANVEPLTVTATSNAPLVLAEPSVDYVTPNTTGSLTLSRGPDKAGWAEVAVSVTEADGDFVSRSFMVSVGDNPLRWQNPASPHDVNGDGIVTPSDVLRLLNELSDPRFADKLGRLPSPPPPSIPPPFLDVNGDGLLAPNDALLVINQINRQLATAGEGEKTPLIRSLSQPWPANRASHPHPSRVGSLDCPSPSPTVPQTPRPNAGSEPATRRTRSHHPSTSTARLDEFYSQSHNDLETNGLDDELIEQLAHGVY